MIRVSIVGAVVFSCFASGAYAEQLGSLTATSTTQPLPGYSFGAGALSPNRYATSSAAPKSLGATSSSGPVGFSLSSPLTLKASTEPAPLLSFRSTPVSTNTVTPTVLPTGGSLATAGGSGSFTTTTTSDPMRWTSTHTAVDSYLGGASQARPALSSPMSTSSFLTPSNAMYSAPRAMR